MRRYSATHRNTCPQFRNGVLRSGENRSELSHGATETAIAEVSLHQPDIRPGTIYRLRGACIGASAGPLLRPRRRGPTFPLRGSRNRLVWQSRVRAIGAPALLY